MALRQTAAVVGAALVLVLGVPFASRGAVPAGAHPAPALTTRIAASSSPAPPDDERCRQVLHVECLRPRQLRRAYGVDHLLARGTDGRGTAIALVEAFGSPTIDEDLAEFDRAFGLPAPPSLIRVHPLGPAPRFDPADPLMVAWAEETSLDVEWAHVMAPAARLVVVETARSEAGAAEGIADVVGAENDVVARGLADVISQSFAEAEGTVGALSATVDTRSAFVAAARKGVTVLAAAGDRGPSGPRPDGGCCLLGGAVWPASDPLVTAVGGTSLRLGAEGERLVDDRVWSDSSGSSGGGLSRIFGRPAFQDGVAGVVGDRRGTPDLSLSAGVDDGAPLYYGSFAAPASPDRWRLGGGTSEATPLLAGIVALADQAAGHRLGPLGDVLYGLAANGDPGIRDITSGDSGFSGCLQRCGTGGAPTVRVPGYAAARGYDLASGLGTVDADRLVAALAGRPPRAGAGP